ncbi:MAG: hypothetical protein SF051_12340 [Elusimicrobiota bacterium]|nr:hypothetical protein [Elusimicrobiota bacterium]
MFLAAAAPAAAADASAPLLHFDGAVAARYLWQPSLRREAFEYLYFVGARVNALQTDGAGLALQSRFATFDTRRYIKGFAATGAGTVAAEPVFNFNRLYLEGFLKGDGARAGLQAGVVGLELPTVQLPLVSMQVGALAGLRADLSAGDWAFGGVAGNLRTDQTHEVTYKIEGLRERWNYARGWVDRRSPAGKTRLGVEGHDTRVKGVDSRDSAFFLEQETPLLDGRLVPRVYARYQQDQDLFSEVVASLEARPWGRWLSVRPGYFYYDRSRRAVHPPNSNFFAPGRDQNNLFLHLESALPRASDSLYAAVTTGAKRFMAQQGTRFETGLFLRFKKFPYLP